MTKDHLEYLQISPLVKKDILFFNYFIGFFELLLVGYACINFYNTVLFVLLIACSLTLLLWGITFRKRFRGIELRDGYLIISDGRANLVITPRSLKRITTIHILHRKLTFVCFSLDGKRHKIILISPDQLSPDKLLMELKNKKADL